MIGEPRLGDNSPIDITGQEPSAVSDTGEPNPEQMADAFNWTKQQVERMPEESFASPEAFGVELVGVVSAILEEAEKRYGSKDYVEPAPKGLAEAIIEKYGDQKRWGEKVRLKRASSSIYKDCAYSFIGIILAKYIQRKGYDAELCDYANKKAEDYSRQRFLQGEMKLNAEIFQDIVDCDPHSIGKCGYEQREEVIQSREKLVADSSNVSELKKIAVELDAIRKGIKGPQINENLKSSGISKTTLSEAFHIVGTEVSQTCGHFQALVLQAEK